MPRRYHIFYYIFPVSLFHIFLVLQIRSSEKIEDSKKKIKVETPPSGTPTNSKSEDLENESLSLLIPDVQTTSMLVHKAVDRYRLEHLKIDGSTSDGDGHGQGSVEELMSTGERYSSVMMPLQFGKLLCLVHRLGQGSGIGYTSVEQRYRRSSEFLKLSKHAQ